MIIHKLIKRGLNHQNYCEDFLLEENINEELSLFAVFDGCSTGVDSHFASALIAKFIRAEIRKLDFSGISINTILELLLYNTLISLKDFKTNYAIDWNELLSTLVIMIYNSHDDIGKIIVIGDGFLSINSEQIEIDQNNQPDYLTYHLDKVNNKEEFKKWYENNVHKYDIEELDDITISTDGILSFTKENITNEDSETDFNAVEYIALNKDMINNKAMLGRKINILKKTHSLYNLDDLGIIRILKSK